MRALLSLLLFAFFSLAHAQQDVDDARRTIAVIEEALQQRPNDPTLWFYLARFQAEAGNTKASIAALEKVAQLGDGFLPARKLGFEKAWDDPAFQAVVARMEAKLPRLDYAPTAFEIEDRALLPEGLAHDTKSATFFMGSIAQRKILRIDALNTVSEFAGPGAGLDAVLGLAVDGPRRRLYAVTTTALTTDGAKSKRNAVIAFDVDTGRLMRRNDVPEATQLNDVTVALGGRVYASDSGSGAIYEIRPEGPARQVVAPNQIRGSNGIATSPDGKRLYVAHSTGLAVVDLVSDTWKRVTNATRENIAGIDGLYEYQGDLVGVQNVTTPGRVILITLSKNGDEVTRVRTLLSHHHTALYEPTTGAVRLDNGYFYLLGATGVSHFNANGRIDRPDEVPNPKVLKVLLPH
jgi:hypothetical protein